ncbi:hypothetical protein L3Y34_000901 [Caenorhabditis briggsae]|uniref:F-box domain-containing protein n=1 Tax=Caenorhabditis briggsae TaxID=6238 RepID=A0AAE9DAT4_CAEBR|nr:hypothetical protein L3Y34_000901 [Caenorhabditis briggsae]
MKLSIFPYLVQKEILENMKISNLFLLSFVSKNIKKLIKSSQITRFNSISHIVYDAPERPVTDSWSVYIPFMPKSDNIMEFTERREETEDDYFQLNVAGKIMDFRLSNQYQYPEAYFHPSEKESAIESIHNYFLDFFGETVEYQYVEHYKEFIPHLPKLSLCLSFWPGNLGRIINIQPIEEYLASSPALKQICMSLQSQQLFRPESKFYQAESISLTLYTRTAHDFLRHFQGRQAFLRCDEYDVSSFIGFMNRWKSGQECGKLEYLKIKLMRNRGVQNQILNANGVKYIDESRTPPTHTLPVVYKYGDFPNTAPIISHAYVVRKTDNRVASVAINRDRFYFGVWNETEEEFLRLVT